MVDYMKTSQQMRSTWGLKEEDQAAFADFDFIATGVLEDELDLASETGAS